MDEIEKKAQELRDEIKAANDKAAALELKVTEMEGKENANQALLSEYKKGLEDLQTSLEDLNKELKTIKEKKVEIKNFGAAIQEVIESAEFKSQLDEMKNGTRARSKSFEIKTDPTSVVTAGLTGDVARTVSPTDIFAAGTISNKFLAVCAVRTIGQDKNMASWFDGTYYSNVGYVSELTALTTGDGAELAEKYREVAKVGAFLPFSSEAMSDMSYFVNWAKNEGVKALLSKVDDLIWQGAGQDSVKPKEVYGIKTQGATAFNATTAGLALSISNANIADVIAAGIAQIKIQGNELYTPNYVFMHPSDVAKLRALKNTIADYLSILPNNVMTIHGLTILETARMTANQLLIVDSSTLQLHVKQGLEMEIERVASSDSWKMHLRWRGNLVVPTNAKLGNVYVSNITTAKAALDVATPTTTLAPTTTQA